MEKEYILDPGQGLTCRTIGAPYYNDTYYNPDKKISLYVLGDEFSGSDMQTAIDAVDRLYKISRDGTRRVRIHAIGFPVMLKDTRSTRNTGVRFATLMRVLCQRNGGTFVGLNTTRP